MTSAVRESKEQEALFVWIELSAKLYPGVDKGFAVPNGAFLQGNARQRAMQWRRLEAQGCRAGVADLFFPGARRGFHGLFIELKREGATKSALSVAQREFLADMEAGGYCARWAPGWVRAAEVLAWYFGPNDAVGP